MKINLKILQAINEGIRKSLLSFDDVYFHQSKSEDVNKSVGKTALESIIQDILNSGRNMSMSEYNMFVGHNNIYSPNDRDELKKICTCVINDEVGHNPDLNWINTKYITDMSNLFYFEDFNGDISRWDVSRVNNMSAMFDGSTFNGDISGWDVSSVKNMDSMFKNSVFNKDISGWDVSGVVMMASMFENSVFNKDISNWNTCSVKNTLNMFKNSMFRQDISKWDISHIKKSNKSGMFSLCKQMPPEYKPKNL